MRAYPLDRHQPRRGHELGRREGSLGAGEGRSPQALGKLTDDDWEVAAGDKDRFIGKLRERYGWSREEAERSAKEYFDNLS